MDTSVPRKAVVAVAFILLAMSALGVYQGWRRAGTGETDSEGGLPSLSAAPVAGAKTASALTDLTPTLTEAQVREIARQEARAALGKPAATPTADAGQDESASAGTAKPTVAPLLPPKPIQAPALQTPVAPAPPAAGDGQNQAPLF